MKNYIYIIKEVVNKKKNKPYIKIGVTHDIKQRLPALQTGNPRELKLMRLIGPFTREQAMSLEKQLHKIMGRHRVNGEWFHSTCLRQLNFICEAGFANGVIPTREEVLKNRRAIKRFEEERRFQIELAESANMYQ